MILVIQVVNSYYSIMGKVRNKDFFQSLLTSLKARFYYERGIKDFLFLLLTFFASLSARLDFKRYKTSRTNRMFRSMLVVETSPNLQNNLMKQINLSLNCY